MFHSVESLRILFSEYAVLKYFVVFLGTALGGEFFLITFSFFAAQGLVSLYALVPLAFLGTYCADLTWFLLARTKRLEQIFEHKYASPAVYVITGVIRRVSHGSHFLALVFAKFLWGTRIITIIYVSKTKVTLKKFLHFNSYAVLLWIAVVIPMGYASGLGYTYVGHVFKSIYASFSFLLLVVGGLTILHYFVKKILERGNK